MTHQTFVADFCCATPATKVWCVISLRELMSVSHVIEWSKRYLSESQNHWNIYSDKKLNCFQFFSRSQSDSSGSTA